jgi:hypothetical protein
MDQNVRVHLEFVVVKTLIQIILYNVKKGTERLFTTNTLIAESLEHVKSFFSIEFALI